MFSGSLCEIRASPETQLKCVQETTAGGAGVTMDWKPFRHRPRTTRNRLGWDQSRQLLCADLSTALVDCLLLGKWTQRETDLPAASPGSLLSIPLPARPFGPSGEKRTNSPGEARLLSSRVSAAFVKQGTHGWVSRILGYPRGTWLGEAPYRGATL